MLEETVSEPDQVNLHDIGSRSLLSGQYKVELTPLLPFTSPWGLYTDFLFLNLIPVCAECRSAALLETLHHRTSRVRVCVCKDLLEEGIDSTVATNIGVLVRSPFLVAGEDICSDTFPVLLLVTDRDLRRRRRRSGTCKC